MMPGVPDFLEILVGVLLVGYLISGLDDLVFDVVYWGRRLLRGQFDPDVQLSELLSTPQKRVAVFLPAWQEAEVLSETLLYNGEIIDYSRYDIFIGTYPNDTETGRCVDIARDWLPNVHKVIAPRPGPTTKADNLNSIFAGMERREEELGERYDFIVLHDAEDVVHPLELRLLNHHFSRSDAAMIQTPIFPLPAPYRLVTTSTYMDQFAEVQTKDLHVRGELGGFVPSCGVATGFTRDALDYLVQEGDGQPFDADSLTEDYEVGLRLALGGLRGQYIRQRVIEDVPAGEGAEPHITPDPSRVATWANFPACYRTSVRQRTRWSMGIVFQSRRQRAGELRLIDRWLLFHDRKALWTYPLVALGYVLFAAVVVVEVIRRTISPDMSPLIDMTGWLGAGVIAVTILMANRLLQRGILTSRVYGWRQGLLSVLRQPWDNIISISALFRAAFQYTRVRLRGETPKWDKTRHVRPVILRKRLGQIMVRKGWLTRDELVHALEIQREDEAPLGEVLIELGYTTPTDRDKALSEQKKAESAV